MIGKANFKLFGQPIKLETLIHSDGVVELYPMKATPCKDTDERNEKPCNGLGYQDTLTDLQNVKKLHRLKFYPKARKFNQAKFETAQIVKFNPSCNQCYEIKQHLTYL